MRHVGAGTRERLGFGGRCEGARTHGPGPAKLTARGAGPRPGRSLQAPLWVVCLVLLTSAGSGCAPRRNLLLITVDTLRRDALGVYDPRVTWTPTLDSLARAGTCWTSAHTPFSLTLPSHATMMTGVAPWEVGLGSNDGVVPESLWCLAEELAGHGYTCAAMVNTWVLEAPSGIGQGFGWVYSFFRDTVACPTGEEKPGHAGVRTNPRASRTVEASLRWLQRAARPFFLWIHLMDPHLDYAPPAQDMAPFGVDSSDLRWGEEEWLKAKRREGHVFTDEERRIIRALYDAEVASVDRALGQLFAGLRALGLEQSTVVAVVSDHGESILDDDSYVGHAHSLHPCVTQIPLIMAGPGIPRATTISAPVELVQLRGTLLQLVRGRKPASGDLFTPARRVPVTADASGRVVAAWGGWRMLWAPGSDPVVVERGPQEGAAAVSLMDSALRALPRFRQGVRRPLSPRDRAALEALGYVEGAGDKPPGSTPGLP